MDIKIGVTAEGLEISGPGFDQLVNLLHPPFECPFCPDWKTCANCNTKEMLALYWVGHMIHAHWEHLYKARELSDGADDIMNYFRELLLVIEGQRKTAADAAAAAEPAAAEPDDDEPAADDDEPDELAAAAAAGELPGQLTIDEAAELADRDEQRAHEHAERLAADAEV